jgi:hypothetical protein
MIATGRVAAILAASTWDPSILRAGVYLAGVLLVGAVAVELFRRYMRSGTKERLSASDQLAQYRSLYEQGVISEEEFSSLRALLGGELRRTAHQAVPTAPAARGFLRRLTAAGQSAGQAEPTPPTNEDIQPPPNGEPRDTDRPTPPPNTGITPA